MKVSTRDPKIFMTAYEQLCQYASNEAAPRTQNFAVAVAVLMYRDTKKEKLLPPLIRSPEGKPISTVDLQRKVCDALYQKEPEFLPTFAEGRIYKPLTKSFKPSSDTQNNWRNSFDIQMGLSCDAPYNEDFLKSPVFLAEPRVKCIHRDPDTGQCTSPNVFRNSTRTCFNPAKKQHAPGPTTTAQMTPKLLHRGERSGIRGYWIIEPTTEVLIDLLEDPAARVPLYPFMAALYGGSTALMDKRAHISPELFQEDIALDDDRFTALFDPNPSNTYNALFLTSISDTSISSQHTGGHTSKEKPAIVFVSTRDVSLKGFGVPPRKSTPYVAGKNLKQFKERAQMAADPTERLRLTEKATRGHAYTLDALYRQLSSQGFQCLEQDGGFDLLIPGPSTAHIFEVKTWRPENLIPQIRSGIAQLYEYRWKNRSSLPAQTLLYLVLDRRPPQRIEKDIAEYLHVDRGILLCWMDGMSLRTLDCYQHILKLLSME